MAETNTTMYKGRPLVRSGNTIYFGDPSKELIAVLTIVSTTPGQDGLAIADNVFINIMDTDETKDLAQRNVKSGVKKSLADALEIADIWLTTELNKKGA